MAVTHFAFCPQCAVELSDWHHEGRLRLRCDGCGWVHWNNPTPVVAAIIEYKDKVLLARNAAWPAKMFALVTGFLEADESPADGIAREVKEETDLDADQIDLIGVYDFQRRNELLICYAVKASGTVRLSEELAEYRLVEPAKLRPWRLGTGPAMAQWMQDRNLSFEWVDSPRELPDDDA
ncbi:MAG: NUDIX domain-containing protein [Burkholderiaceae bacterium]